MAGRKNFVAGEILTAADVNSFLMDQSVMVFDDSAARGSAIPSPSEGMVTYRKDDKAVEVFDGSAFELLGGKILQVVQGVRSSAFSASVAAGNSVAITGLTAAITPRDTDSRLVILANIVGANDNPGRSVGFDLTANSSVISASLGDSDGSRRSVTSMTGASASQTISPAGIVFVFSPSSVSTQTIGVNIVNLETSTQTVYVNRSRDNTNNVQSGRPIASLVVMEVAA